MAEVIATPTSLRIRDHEIPLDGEVEFVVGAYEGRRGPNSFYWEYAKNVARKRGINFDNERVSSDTEYYYFDKMGDVFNREKTPKILCAEVIASMPEYVKFLRITPEPVENWVNKVLQPLEERINALGLEGLRALVSTRPSGSRRGPRDPIPTGVELALSAAYSIKIDY